VTATPADPAVPASVAAERALLGAAMLDAEAATAVLVAVTVADLELPRHRTIYSAIAAALEDTGDASPLGVAAVLEQRRRIAEIGGTGTLLDMATEAADLAGRERIGEHARIVVAAAERRRMAAAIAEAHVAAQRGADADELRERLARATPPQVDAADEGYPAVDWRSLATAPATEWLVDGWLPEASIGFLYGEPSSGKSFVALDLAARMATGRPWFGLAVRPGPALWIVGEGFGGVGARIAAWRREHGPGAADHPLEVVDGVPPLTLEHAHEYHRIFAGFAQRHDTAPRLCWIDTFAQGLLGGENEDSAVLPALRLMSDLRRRYGSSVWALAHPRKRTASDGDRPMTAADLRGHGALRGNVDGLIGVEIRKEARRILPLKVKDGGDPPSLGFALRQVETGRRRHDGRQETSCIVVPAAAPQAAPAPCPVAEDAQRAAAAEAMVRHAVEVCAAMGGAPSKTAIVLRMSGRRDARFVAVETAIARGLVGDCGRNRHPRFVAVVPTSPQSPPPHTPPVPGTDPGTDVPRTGPVVPATAGTGGDWRGLVGPMGQGITP
jgi:hypothetical protein